MVNYVDFISNEDFEEVVRSLIEKYEKTKDEMSYKKFTANQIDPIKFTFDKNILDQSDEEKIKSEITRKIDKTITNAIGDFHEDLLGKIKGYKKYPVGYGYDIKADDNSLYADIKNKHNTVKGSDLKNLYKNLESYIQESENPNAKAYWVQIISNGKSFNQNWNIPKEDLNNPNIFKISGDKFYELLTGKKNAFYDMCIALPKVINKVKNENQYKKMAQNTQIINDLKATSENKNIDITTQIFNETFKHYNGFPIKP